MESIQDLKVKYEYIPKLARRWLKPSAILQNWTHAEVRLVAEKLHKAFNTSTEINLKDYKAIVAQAGKLKGVGTYSKEHLFRTACLVCNKKHPSKTFVVMGGGASKKHYQLLAAEGIKNIDELNCHLNTNLDAGDVAYYFCMGKK